MSPWIDQFLKINRKMAASLERRLPAPFKRHLFTSYKYLVARRIDEAKTRLTVLDIGGGKDCPYWEFVRNINQHDIVALDIDEHELEQNSRCHLKVVADAASQALPFSAGTADLITSRSVIEHLSDNASFLQNCGRTLRAGGLLISAFPCRRAPFALINKVLPDRWARGLLFFFHPNWRGACGFKVFYDHCSYPEMRRLLEATGFELIHYELRYYQAIYFDFFVPLYVLMVLYDLLLWRLDAKSLSCQMLFVARKRAT